MTLMMIPFLLWCGSPATIEAKIVYVDVKNGFVAINKGKGDGLGSDYEYAILRKAGNQTTLIGRGRFEKYLGGQQSLCKLMIDDGTVQQMQVDDIVLCRPKG